MKSTGKQTRKNSNLNLSAAIFVISFNCDYVPFIYKATKEPYPHVSRRLKQGMFNKNDWSSRINKFHLK